jgi:hypothetical protein
MAILNEGYCTGWVDGFWGYCCKLHDLAYEIGVERAKADWDLLMCVASSASSSGDAWWMGLVALVMAILMFVTVRILGWLYYPHKKTKREI